MENLLPKLIWIDDESKKDSYIEFFGEFDSYSINAFIDIGVDTDYELYINEKFINCGAYSSYPGKLILDTLNVSLKEGKNTIRVIVYYNGADTFATYYKKDPCLYLKVYNDKKVIYVSDENTKSRYSNRYLSNNERKITYQLGYKVFYSFTNKENEYKNSKVLSTNLVIENRPNKKCVFLNEVKGEKVNGLNESTYDLKKETVGFLKFSITSKKEKDIRIFFGEHIKEGRVLGEIDGRDFSFNIHLKEGKNSTTIYLRRIGCRYFSIDDTDDIEIEFIGMIPFEYPFNEKEYTAKNELDKKIIETAKYTVKCCYHDHFEDCPWREQAEYTFDTKCTLLGVYKAFDNLEAVKSALKLMIDDPREDGDLDMTFPSKFCLVIPSFTLHFIPLIYEYYKETNDIELLKSSINKIELILDAYFKKIKDGLLNIKKDDSHWIFYEWKDGFDGNGAIVPEKDFLLNVLYLYDLIIASKIYKDCNLSFKYNEEIETLKKNINEYFFNKEKQTFIFSKENPITSELMLSYAILTDLKPEMNETFAKQIIEKKVNESTNSFKSMVYEALLKVSNVYKDYILNEIRDIYSKMLDDGATTFYETNLGYLDFNKAGSLCHGWNAYIIKYLLEL